MAEREPRTTTIKVGALARVEGEGALHVTVRGDAVEDVRLEIYEPPRFFEALLRERPFTDAPDITSRICGICPIAYQMSACAAIAMASSAKARNVQRVKATWCTATSTPFSEAPAATA